MRFRNIIDKQQCISNQAEENQQHLVNNMENKQQHLPNKEKLE